MAFRASSTNGLVVLTSAASKGHIQVMRKLWHLGVASLVAILYWSMFPAKSTALALFGGVGGTLLLTDLFRLRVPQVNVLLIKIFQPFIRYREYKTLTSMASFIVATFFAILFFPRPITVLAILYFAIGDPVASTIGLIFGKKLKIRGTKKSWPGTIACFLTCAAITLLFTGLTGYMTSHPFIFALIGASAAAFAEAAPLGADDNFTIPLISGTALLMATLIL